MNIRFLAVLLAVTAAACGGSNDITGCTTPGGCGGVDTAVTPTNVPTGWLAKSMVVGGVTYNYKVFVPPAYNPSTTRIPIILFMHGSGEKGTDNVKQTQVGLGPVVTANANTFPAIAVFPQAPLGEGVDPDLLALTAFEKTLTEYSKVDTKREYLTGLSFGGVHSYNLAFRQPTRWAAYVPIAATLCDSCITGVKGAGLTQAIAVAVPAMKAMNIWQFQGGSDPQILPAWAEQIAAGFSNAGSTTYKYTEYPGAGHEIWDTVYASNDMWNWLWSKKTP